jgi:cytochrome c peroxidase
MMRQTPPREEVCFEAAEVGGVQGWWCRPKRLVAKRLILYLHGGAYTMGSARFYKPRLINGMMASADGPIKTFPLRGIKDSPPYLHDDRLLTLEDTVEYFNLILGTRLTAREKQDLVAFMRAL